MEPMRRSSGASATPRLHNQAGETAAVEPLEAPEFLTAAAELIVALLPLEPRPGAAACRIEVPSLERHDPQ